MKYNKGTSRKNREKHVSGKRAVAPLRAMKLRVKKGDKVRILSGKDKGKTGEIVRAMPKEGKVVVEGIALAKRHLRSTGRGQSGRIVERPMPVDASNVALLEKRATKKAKA